MIKQIYRFFQRFHPAIKWVAGGILLLLAAGLIYQNQAEASYRRDHTPPGALIDMGGYRLHIYCTGKGSPTILLIAGAGDIYAIWEPVQNSLAQSTRVCSYDRPGLGWSDFHPDTELTVEEQVAILHQLLKNAREDGPYLAVGHSIGGLLARTFAATYPKEMQGAVLVESSVGAQFAALPSAILKANRSAGTVFALCQVVAPFGLPRLLGMGDARAQSQVELSLEAQAAIAADFNRAQGCLALQRDSAMVDRPLIKGEPPISLGDLPLVVITRGLTETELNPTAKYSADQVALFDQVQKIWLDIQGRLPQLSTHSNWVIAKNSGHYVHIKEPEVVISAIQSLLSRP